MDGYIVRNGFTAMSDRLAVEPRRHSRAQAKVELTWSSVGKMASLLAGALALFVGFQEIVLDPNTENKARAQANLAIDYRLDGILRAAQAGMASEREFNLLRTDIDRRFQEILSAIDRMKDK